MYRTQTFKQTILSTQTTSRHIQVVFVERCMLSRWTFEYMNDDVLLLNLPQCQPKSGFKGGLSFKTNILQIHLYLKYSHTVLMN